VKVKGKERKGGRRKGRRENSYLAAMVKLQRKFINKNKKDNVIMYYM